MTATGDNIYTFNHLVEMRINSIRKVLNQKANEYAQKDDRFHNFNVAARRNNTTPEKALQGMMAKHDVCVTDMIEHPEIVTKEMIAEKIGDNINYLILLEGMLTQRLKGK